jgi:hypothetical protein
VAKPKHRTQRKPAESAEIDVDPLRVREMTGAERAALMARALDDHPELAELIPERLR